jgi:UDP:flavonoid glycosyltransferase YjiC (YdhE family)
MRVLLTSSAGLGHVYSMIPLARALSDAGHDLLYATPLSGKAAVQAAGVAWVGAGDPGSTPADVLRAFPDVAAMPLADRTAAISAKLFGALIAPAMLEALEPIAVEFDPDLVVADALAFAGPIVAARLGVPCVAKGFGPALEGPRVARGADEVVGLWQARGLDPRPYGGLYDTLYLDIYPPRLDHRPGPHVTAVQPMRQDAYNGESTGDVSLPAGEGPLVYFTMGTVFGDAEAMRVTLDGLSGLGARVLATVGTGVDPAALGPQPANVRVERFVPQTAVLPHCTVVVSHGGSGTTLAAAARGLPQLCLPKGADQFLNGAAVARAGCGLSLRPDEASAEAIATAAASLLHDPAFATAAAEVADSIAAMPAPAEIVAVLERIARRS